MREPDQLRNGLSLPTIRALGDLGGRRLAISNDHDVSRIRRYRLARLKEIRHAKSPTLLRSGPSHRYGSGLMARDSGAHSRARYLPPVFLSNEGNARTLEAFPSYRPEFHLGEWS